MMQATIGCGVNMDEAQDTVFSAFWQPKNSVSFWGRQG
jgi:hypothetical protein